MRCQILSLSLTISLAPVVAFVPSTTTNVDRLVHRPLRHVGRGDHDWRLAVSMAEPPDHVSMIETPFVITRPKKQAPTSFMLTQEEAKGIITIGKEDGKQKIINAYGLWCAAVSLSTAPIWFAAMQLVKAVSIFNKDWDPNREIYDKTGKLWCKAWLTMIDSCPHVRVMSIVSRKGGMTEPACTLPITHLGWTFQLFAQS